MSNNRQVSRRKRRRNRRNRNNNNNGIRIPNYLPPMTKMFLRSHAIPGEPWLLQMMEGIQTLRTNTVTTGVLAIKEAFALSSDLPILSTRYSTAYNEYAVAMLQLDFIPDTVSTGYTIAWVSSDTGQTPDVTEAQAAYPRINIKHTSAPDKTYSLQYYPSGTEELVWTPIGTDIAFNMRIYAYTDSSFGAPIVATGLFSTKWKALIAMRGLAS